MLVKTVSHPLYFSFAFFIFIFIYIMFFAQLVGEKGGYKFGGRNKQIVKIDRNALNQKKKMTQ